MSVPVLTIQAAVVLWNTVICCFTYYKFFHHILREIAISIRTMCMIAVTCQLVLSIVNLVGFYEISLCPITDNCFSQTFVIASASSIGVSSASLCFIYSLMAIRVINLLKNSIFELSKREILYILKYL